ncbi:protein translocase subunit SecD [Nesterenkonia aerolata]|uniref:Protein translocase subunit SecD n=1 Tax=Nesterenkonia aerolata TaxID=3074079 RepID=A0ABU2DS04_9MICC|nr:protein translocase subunit SecD [Nesterenkonia sp. LY-0111]MDR8019155.1 protein translocase subunit SecD [Nesterenkonia sp. LY-0111]
MATSKTAARARGALIGMLILLLGMGGLLAYGVSQGKAQWAPLLALDLSGGTQMVLSPQVDGDETLDDEQLEQAVEIIRQRVDGTGVAEAEIATQGAENVVVGMPGSPDEETRELIQASADMEFRPVLQAEPDMAYIDEFIANEDEDADVEEAAPTEDAEDGTANDAEDGTEDGTEDEETAEPEDFPEPSEEPTDPSDTNWISQDIAAEFANYRCSRDLSIADRQAAESEEPLVTCDPETGTKYILGPVEVPGDRISGADFGTEQSQSGMSTGRWAVTITFDSAGTDEFRESTSRLVNLPDVRNQFAIVLDGHVISAPRTQAAITDGRPQITGDFTEDEARNLSEQLRYGSLPISFQIESEEQISATLGSDQLRMGLLAGVIGLLLVAGYAVFQYRALSIVTITSLVVAGLMTWFAISLLGWSDGYRLSLAGIAGLIVSIGLTADSFIVYFERIKDELREGRSLAGAVESGWERARRTILASKAVNIIAAAVLFLVAVGNVRGFAFTLGLTAIIDVALVFLFTHPVMRLLARRRFFAQGRSFSGLSAKELGVDVLYRGAGRFSRREVVYSTDSAVVAVAGEGAAAVEESDSRPAVRERLEEDPESSGLTIAERRRARTRRAVDEPGSLDDSSQENSAQENGAQDDGPQDEEER